VNRTKLWVGFDNRTQYAFQGLAKLHGIFWRQLVGVVVDFEEGVINDNTGSSIPLWDDTHRGDAHQLVDLGVLLDAPNWNYHPVSFVDEIDEFTLKEFGVLMG
jgi:hypothetical protein